MAQQAEEKCYLCGEGGHRQFECPNQKLDVYQLPDQMKAAAQAQYERDIARVKGASPPMLPCNRCLRCFPHAATRSARAEENPLPEAPV